MDQAKNISPGLIGYIAITFDLGSLFSVDLSKCIYLMTLPQNYQPDT